MLNSKRFRGPASAGVPGSPQDIFYSSLRPFTTNAWLAPEFIFRPSNARIRRACTANKPVI
jgi:hypothetical protein